MSFIGGVILIGLSAFWLWLLLFPAFSKVGEKVTNKYNKFKDEENVRESENI